MGVQHALDGLSPADQSAEREADRVATAVTGRGATPTAAALLPAAASHPTVPATSTGLALGLGTPLDSGQRAFFEPRLGQDLSHVRVHTGPDAQVAAAEARADAFTVGSDIAFGAGRYAPRTAGGATLLAHELAHVVQQSVSGPKLARQQSEYLPGLDPFATTWDPGPSEPFTYLPPEAVVVTGQTRTVTPVGDPLAAYPTLAASLPEESYNRLRRLADARRAAQAASGIGPEPVRSRAELAGLRRSSSVPAAEQEPVEAPLASFVGLDAQYVNTDFATALVPYLLAQSAAPPELVALVMRNEVVRRLMTIRFPSLTTLSIALEDPLGRTPGPPRLAFAVNGVTVDLPDGFLHHQQLDRAAGGVLERIKNAVVRDAETLSEYATLVIRARLATERVPGLIAGIAGSPDEYALRAVQQLRDDVVGLVRAIGGFSSDLVTPGQMAELRALAGRLEPHVAPLQAAVAQVEDLHRRTAIGATVDEAADYQMKLAEEGRKEGGVLGFFRSGFWGQSSGQTRAAKLVPGSRTMDEAVLAYQRGDISLDSFHSIILHTTIKTSVGMVVGTAAALLGGWLGLAGGAAVFGTGTVGATVTGGAVGGLFGGVGTLLGEDVYSATVAAVSVDPALSAAMRSSYHTPGEYLFAGAFGTGLGAGFGALSYTPRVAPPPITLFGPTGSPMLVSGGRVLPRPPAAGPIRLYGATESESILVSGGRVVAQPPATGPVRLFGPTESQSVLVAGGQVVPEATTTLAGGSRLVTPSGVPIGGVPRPTGGLVDPLGRPLAPAGGGPVIVDLQSGQAQFLRDITKRIPGAQGIGVESGDWLLGYQGIHPVHPGDLGLSRSLVRTSPIWPDTPAWRTPFGQLPRALPWEIEPGPFFWPQTGAVRVFPEPFFPPFGGQGRLVPSGFGDIAGIRPTTHPQLHGIADQVYLRRPFGLARADAPTTRALGTELNQMLRRGGFVELRLTRQGEFSVPTAGSTGPDQLAVVASQIEGATVVRVDAGAIRAFARTGRPPPGLTPIQEDMLRNAASDVGGAGALGQGDIVRLIRIYKGTPQNVLLVGPETQAEFGWARALNIRGQGVTAANPTATPAAEAFASSGGRFFRGRIEELPAAQRFDLIREDFPVPLGRALPPTAEFARARIGRLVPGGRWVVVTEDPEFARTLRVAGEQHGATVRYYEVPGAHEAVPLSLHPRESSRHMLIFEKPR